MWRWPDAHFVAGAPRVGDLPTDTGVELAFCGRSNAGKSSALNRLTGVAGLARVSKTPGRTQQLNIFALDTTHRLVDLPGYGYARVPHALRASFLALLQEYIATRHCLRGLVLVADIRQGLKNEDDALLAARPDLPTLILLSKSDKINRSERARQVREIAQKVPTHAFILPFSSLNGDGVDEAREYLTALLNEQAPPES